MLVDTHASKNDKTPRASYSFKGSCKTSCVHYKPCQVVKSNKQTQRTQYIVFLIKTAS